MSSLNDQAKTTKILCSQIKEIKEKMSERNFQINDANNLKCPTNNTYLQKRKFQESFEEAPLYVLFITYMGYMILNVFGYIRDFIRAIGLEEKKGAKDNNPKVNIYLLTFRILDYL